MTTTALVATVGQRFTVTGMTCGHCEMAVTTELSKLEGISRIDVDLATGHVFTESATPLSIEAVTAAVDEAGYELAR